MAKQKTLLFLPSKSFTTTCFDLVYMDIWGPYHAQTLYGHQYFLTIVDDFSWDTWVYLMKGKYEVRHSSSTHSIWEGNEMY